MPVPVTPEVVTAVLTIGGSGGIVILLLRRFLSRIDNLDIKVQTLDRDKADEADVNTAINRIEDTLRMETKQIVEKIDNVAGSTHQRIDEHQRETMNLYTKIMEMLGQLRGT